MKNNLKIISGKFKNKKIYFNSKFNIKPTMQNIKTIIFSLLKNKINNALCLDLYAGSGALGFECLSNDALNVFFIDKNIKVCKNIFKNLKNINIKNFKILNLKALSFLLKNKLLFDLIFIDPPYNTKNINKIIKLSIKQLNNNGILYVETNKKINIKDLNIKIFRKKGNTFFYLIFKSFI
ncbi:16S rRNA (guanine(966)-N(2))-methyltransferase RsmD [Candidatus Vidania fulgoroideorum]